MDDYLGFIEFFVVAMFVMAWGVLELVGKRLDRKRSVAYFEVSVSSRPNIHVRVMCKTSVSFLKLSGNRSNGADSITMRLAA